MTDSNRTTWRLRANLSASYTCTRDERRASRVVRGELQGVRRGLPATEGCGGGHAASRGVQEAGAELAALRTSVTPSGPAHDIPSCAGAAPASANAGSLLHRPPEPSVRQLPPQRLW